MTYNKVNNIEKGEECTSWDIPTPLNRWRKGLSPPFYSSIKIFSMLGRLNTTLITRQPHKYRNLLPKSPKNKSKPHDNASPTITQKKKTVPTLKPAHRNMKTSHLI
ncbi:hypothetical protein LOAG_03821 [Loa loa]|uniref:Uncharacterized protein n=1 Tax=Loa loa TaxID=7209 RepID=A0A1S0U3U1_LOALO|nr:hypothetical protein LOAG_03821 [Loa loa]EFO24661.1 hypothetical protein LOAG_03821 [Loa loa]